MTDTNRQGSRLTNEFLPRAVPFVLAATASIALICAWQNEPEVSAETILETQATTEQPQEKPAPGNY